MNNFELIDDFLTNRLDEPEKAAFEKELNTNAALKAEVAVQRLAIEGVKKARAAELKAMLKNLPVGGTSLPMGWSILKIAAGVVGAGLLIAGLAHYFKGEENLNPTNLSTSIEDSMKDSVKKLENQPEPMEEEKPKLEEVLDEKTKLSKSAEEKKSQKKAVAQPNQPAQPKIEVIDPTEEMTENSSSEKSQVKSNRKSMISVSHIAVETDATNKKYSFHYQFNQGKLHLYGNFDKGLYEVLEVIGDSHAVFMYYKELYYLLDEKQSTITLLEPIKDKTLISKLKEYRGR